MEDLIHTPTRQPSFDEIAETINPPARALWLDLNGFIQESFQAKPKITYSICAGQPGWNVKYQKSGQSICTLYPDKDCWIALVVIKVEMAALLPSARPAFHSLILRLAASARPFNNTLWLMIPVADGSVLESLKDLLVQKRNFGKP